MNLITILRYILPTKKHLKDLELKINLNIMYICIDYFLICY